MVLTSELPSRFQSTPPRREMTAPVWFDADIEFISIHTSPKGDDERDPQHGNRAGISIHTSPKGDDVSPPSEEISAAEFQSTPPRREMTPDGSRYAVCSSFQSTPPRREMTRHRQSAIQHPLISIHTSPKGDDVAAIGALIATSPISIHTSPKGDDVDALLAQVHHIDFNPHLPEGR